MKWVSPWDHDLFQEIYLIFFLRNSLAARFAAWIMPLALAWLTEPETQLISHNSCCPPPLSHTYIFFLLSPAFAAACLHPPWRKLDFVCERVCVWVSISACDGKSGTKFCAKRSSLSLSLKKGGIMSKSSCFLNYPDSARQRKLISLVRALLFAA